MTRRSRKMDRVSWPFRAFKRYCKSQYKGSSWVVNSQHGLAVHFTIHSLTFIAIDKAEEEEGVVGFCRPIMLTIQLRLTAVDYSADHHRHHCRLLHPLGLWTWSATFICTLSSSSEERTCSNSLLFHPQSRSGNVQPRALERLGSPPCNVPLRRVITISDKNTFRFIAKALLLHSYMYLSKGNVVKLRRKRRALQSPEIEFRLTGLWRP